MAQATLASNQTRYGLVYVFPETEGEKPNSTNSTVYLITGSVIIGIVVILIFLYLWFRLRKPASVPIVLTAPMAQMAPMVPTAPMAQIRPTGATMMK